MSDAKVSYVCADCRNVFVQPPRCVTCGAERLRDATAKWQGEEIARLRGRVRALEGLVRYLDGSNDDSISVATMGNPRAIADLRSRIDAALKEAGP